MTVRGPRITLQVFAALVAVGTSPGRPLMPYKHACGGTANPGASYTASKLAGRADEHLRVCAPGAERRACALASSQ